MPKAVELPWFWARQVDSASGRPYFLNHVLQKTFWELPTEPTIDVDIMSPGSMGVEVERAFSGSSRFGRPSGRRNSGVDAGAVVRAVTPGSQADVASSGKLLPGFHLIAINGTSTLQWPLEVTVSALGGAGRPVRLTFHNPYSVPRDAAEYAMRS
jgi:hypothetical protein